MLGPRDTIHGDKIRHARGLYGILNERGVSKVGILYRTVNHLIRLINNLLDLEKMDAGLLGLNLEQQLMMYLRSPHNIREAYRSS